MRRIGYGRRLKEYVVAMMHDSHDEISPLEELRLGMEEGAELQVSLQHLRATCDVLVTEGMLEIVGRDEKYLPMYRCTAAYLAKVNALDEECFADAIAEHVIKKAARK